MEDLDKRIADRVKRKKAAGQDVDAEQFAKRSDATDNASAGVPEREALTGAGAGEHSADLDALSDDELRARYQDVLGEKAHHAAGRATLIERITSGNQG